ncbi:MAG: hypothetical protein DMF78_26575 [Acidobacteria bacterium]|nr:MAG: hypothetical protein DMF78_26575 [Acidobacteriota bacterium]
MPPSHPVYERWKGRHVRFRVRDVHLPAPSEVLDEMHGGDVLEGKVVDVSDNGTEAGLFVVIQVDGLRRPCVLAVERILRAV